MCTINSTSRRPPLSGYSKSLSTQASFISATFDIKTTMIEETIIHFIHTY